MYHVTVQNDRSTTYQVSADEYKFNIALKKGEGISPMSALLASLGACMCVYTNKYLEGTKLAVKDVTVNVEADFGEEKPLAFRRIKATVDLHGQAIDEERKKALINFLKNCPVHNTLKAGPSIEMAVSQ
ncbi:MAG: OsmC family protein [Candidatus Omnitrophica bacterium]|nr:OsmC family protein [Candidatus Omnitrophota bacterium]